MLLCEECDPQAHMEILAVSVGPCECCKADAPCVNKPVSKIIHEAVALNADPAFDRQVRDAEFQQLVEARMEIAQLHAARALPSLAEFRAAQLRPQEVRDVLGKWAANMRIDWREAPDYPTDREARTVVSTW